MGEMYRLLDRENLTNEHYNWWDTFDIQNYLNSKDSKFIFRHVDKNVFAFGFELEKLSGFWLPLLTVETATLYLQKMNELFWDEIKKLDIDLSIVTIEQMEDASIDLKNPQPILFG